MTRSGWMARLGLGRRPKQNGAYEEAGEDDYAQTEPSGHDGWLTAVGVRKSYKRRLVVRGVDLAVRRGEAVGLLGPNGAGKTTVFYMITGLVPAPQCHDVAIEDRLESLPCRDRPGQLEVDARVGGSLHQPQDFDGCQARQDSQDR
jgi:ABC-type glutathione transport system ATPase component